MTKQDTLENQANIVYIGIGTNLGNRINNIEKTKYFLSLNGIKIIKTSRYYESFSWPDPRKPKFYNVVIQLKTNSKPAELLSIFKSIEIKLGRKKSTKNWRVYAWISNQKRLNYI